MVGDVRSIPVVGAYVAATPWFLPGVAVAAVLALVVVRVVGARLTPRLRGWTFLTVVGSYVALVVSPTSAALEGYARGSTSVSLGVHLPPVRDFLRIGEVSLNLVAGVALGLVAVWLAVGRRRWWPLAVAVAVPVLAEAAQRVIPALGRSGFLMTDVVIAEVGVVVGTSAAGLVVVAATGPSARRTGKLPGLSQSRRSPSE